MNTLSYKTVYVNKETAKKEWYVVNAEGQILGRLASKVAKILRGKNKPEFSPHVDCGDNIIIINAEKIRLTGNKLEKKEYLRHTGYPGGQRKTTPGEIMKKNPSKIIEIAVKGMLPKNRLGNAIFKNLYIYNGPEHTHDGQQPVTLNLNSIK